MKALTLAEVGKLLGVAQRTVEAWVKSGELRTVNVSRNRLSAKPRLRVLQADFDKFIESRTPQSEPAPARRTRRKPADIPSYV